MPDNVRKSQRIRQFRRHAMRGGLLIAALVLGAQAIMSSFDWRLLAAALVGLCLCLVIPVPSNLPATKADLVFQPIGGRERLSVAETVLADLTDPVIAVDGEQRILQANAAAQTLFPALLEGDVLSFGLRNPALLGAVAQVVSGNGAVTRDYVQRVPDERHFEVGITPLAMVDGGSQAETGAVLLFRERTTAHRLEEMRVEFVANASHELRTPLAVLTGAIDTLQTTARDDRVARERFLALMREQAQRMTRLIDNLLSLSRIEMRLHQQPDEAVDLISLINRAIANLSRLAAESDVILVFAPLQTPFLTRGDGDELQRVAENLIENAIKYGGSGKRVDIALARVDAPPGADDRAKGRILLTVTDHGPGIARQDLPRLTERFFRADSPVTKAKSGSGLGLAIVKHILARHKGSLSIDSTPGEGAAFIVSLEECELSPKV